MSNQQQSINDSSLPHLPEEEETNLSQLFPQLLRPSYSREPFFDMFNTSSNQTFEVQSSPPLSGSFFQHFDRLVNQTSEVQSPPPLTESFFERFDRLVNQHNEVQSPTPL